MAPVDAAGEAVGEAVSDALRVDVVFCPQPGVCDTVSLTLATGATVADALQASGLLLRHGLEQATVKVGVWSRVRELTAPLRPQDRVEIYRALQVDPKEARRQRYKRHRSGAAAAPR